MDKKRDSAIVNVEEASAILKEEFDLERSPQQLRKLARDGKVPFFQLDDNKTSPYFIQVGDLRNWIRHRRNAAINRQAA